MSRTAQIHRTTGETDVQLSLDLDGTGAGERATGVGFFDHMLDALARHGRLDLDVEVEGDLETGAHHTVEDVGIVLGQALDEALGDRAGIRRFGHAVVPMDEARASAAIDISGRPFTSFEGEFPAERVGDFETDLTEEFFRAVANAAKLTLHVRVEAGTQRPPHGRGVLQGVRARAARGGRARRPGVAGVPSTKGAPVTRVAILDYGMGNLRSVEKALEHVGAEPDPDARPRARARGRRRRAARRGRVAEGDGARARARPRRAAARARRGGVPVLGICLGMQLLFESHHRARRRRGLGLLRGPVRGARRARPEGAADRLEPGGWRRDERRSPRACPTRAPSTTCTRSRRGRRTTDAVLGTAEYGSRVRQRGRADARVRRPVPPGEVGPGRAARC